MRSHLPRLVHCHNLDREVVMSWKKPRVTEICLALEINCYASAKV
jgi:coenzyme PQQ precursor peptide PqqA